LQNLQRLVIRLNKCIRLCKLYMYCIAKLTIIHTCTLIGYKWCHTSTASFLIILCRSINQSINQSIIRGSMPLIYFTVPTNWNSLPDPVRSLTSLFSSCNALKIFVSLISLSGLHIFYKVQCSVLFFVPRCCHPIAKNGLVCIHCFTL